MESLKCHFNSSYFEKKKDIPTKKKLEIEVRSNLIKFREHRVPNKSYPKRFIQKHILKMKKKKKEDKERIFTTARVKQLVMYKESHKAVLYCARSLQSCKTLCNPMDCSQPGSSVHGILQARILGWVAMPFSRGSSQSRDQAHISYVSCVVRWVLYH